MSTVPAQPPLHGRGATRLAAWFGFAQLIPLLVSPVLTRLYSPEEIGQWAIFAALVFIIGSVAPLRFDQVVLVARLRRHGLEASVIGIVCACLCAVAVAAVVHGGGGRVLAKAFGSGASAWTALLAPCVLLLATAMVVNGWLLRNSRFSAVGIVRFGQTSAASVLGVAFGLVGLPHGLIAAQLSGLALTATISGWLLGRALFAARRLSTRRLLALSARYRRFPLHGTPAALVSSLGTFLPLLIFGHLFGEAESGQFALARQCLLAVTGVLSVATGQAFMLAATQCVRLRGSLVALLRRQLARQVVLAAGFLVAAAVVAPHLFTIAFGANWAPAGDYARWLAFPLAAALLVSPVSGLLLAVERVGTNSAWQFGSVSALALLALPAYDKPTNFLGALIVVIGVSYSIYLGLILYAARAHDRGLRR